MQLNDSFKDDLNHHHRSEQSQSNNEQEIIDESYDQSELDNEERNTDGSHEVGNSESITSEHVNQQNSANQIAVHSDKTRGEEDIEQDTSNFEFIFSVHARENNGIRNSMENDATEWLQETAVVESGPRGHVQEADDPFHDNDAPRSEASDTHEVYGPSNGLIRSTFEDYEWQVLLSQAEDPPDTVLDHEESNLRQSEAPYELVTSSSKHSETTNDTTEDMSRSWQEGAANHWYRDSSENDTEEQIYEQEQHEDWQSNDWLDMPSGPVTGSMRRVDSFYMPDDDSVYNVELQELLSR